jgi:hypothetical protein
MAALETCAPMEFELVGVDIHLVRARTHGMDLDLRQRTRTTEWSEAMRARSQMAERT